MDLEELKAKIEEESIAILNDPEMRKCLREIDRDLLKQELHLGPISDEDLKNHKGSIRIGLWETLGYSERFGRIHVIWGPPCIVDLSESHGKLVYEKVGYSFRDIPDFFRSISNFYIEYFNGALFFSKYLITALLIFLISMVIPISFLFYIISIVFEWIVN